MTTYHNTGEIDYPRVVFRAAMDHGGNGDIENEIGDLEDFILALWDAMTPEQRLKVMSKLAWDDDSNFFRWADPDVIRQLRETTRPEE